MTAHTYGRGSSWSWWLERGRHAYQDWRSSRVPLAPCCCTSGPAADLPGWLCVVCARPSSLCAGPMEDEEEDSFSSRLVTKIVDNIQLDGAPSLPSLTLLLRFRCLLVSVLSWSLALPARANCSSAACIDVLACVCVRRADAGRREAAVELTSKLLTSL